MSQTMDGYIRVSRKMGREGDSYISPSVQREAIERWATYKGITIAEWHVDEDWSGGTHKRPGLESAISRALAGETEGIVSWKIDRFSRYTEGGLRDLRRLQSVDARLVFVTEDIDTRAPMGKFVYVIMLAMAEYFLDNIKASWETAKARATARGAPPGKTPWGFVRNDNGTLSPHPTNAPKVREAFRLAAGQDVGAASRYLQREAPEDRTWTASAVRRLLAQSAYMGDARVGDHVGEGAIASPIVTRAIWEAAQSSPQNTRPAEGYPLSGVVTCASCGQHMVGSRAGQHRIYRCAGSLTRSRVRCRTGPAVRADILENHIRDTIIRLMPRRVTISPAPAIVSDLEEALAEARAELEAFLSDLTLRRAMGERYQPILQQRVDAVTEAENAFRSQARAAAAITIEYDANSLVTDDELLTQMSRGLYEAIIVRRAHHRHIPIADRVELIPFHTDDAAGMAS